MEEETTWVKYQKMDLKWKSILSRILSIVELVVIHCQFDTTYNHQRREHITRDSLGQVVLWEIVLITLIQVGRHFGWYHSLGFSPGLCKCKKEVTYE